MKSILHRAAPDYGPHTLCRPIVLPVLSAPAGWVEVECAYCGRGCWKRPCEPDPLPPGLAAACTTCALQRHTRQAEMDRQRYLRETERN